MAYEVFKNKATRLGTPAVTITTDGRYSLNADAGDLLRGVKAKFVHILWDSEARKIALKPVPKLEEHSYRLTSSKAHKRGMYLSATAFMRSIGFDLSERHTLPVEWNDKEKLLEFSLPADQGSKRKMK